MRIATLEQTAYTCIVFALPPELKCDDCQRRMNILREAKPLSLVEYHKSLLSPTKKTIWALLAAGWMWLH